MDEQFSPSPSPEAADLAPYLAEVASREIARQIPVDCIVLRLADVVSAVDGESEAEPFEWLHIDDAVQAVAKAIDAPPSDTSSPRWRCLNIVRGDPSSRYPLGQAAAAPFSFTPHHLRMAEREPARSSPSMPSRPGPLYDLPVPDRVLILGAGGPLASAASLFLRDGHRLRLADLRPLAELDFSQDGPRPEPTMPPHEELIVDVTDAVAVTAAAHDADCLINCTVIRTDPVEAFRVNVLGAYNVMCAAVAAGVRRVVFTGPALTLGPHPVGYTDDRAVESNVPPRPGSNLYGLSKFLGQEICRVFAEWHEIATPMLLFVGFVQPGRPLPGAAHPFSISWADAGRAVAAAVDVPALPEPAPVLHVLADAPHERYRNTAAKHVLGWTPLDRLDAYW